MFDYESYFNAHLGEFCPHVLRLLCALDNPQSKLRVIHIAGTNGKSSTAAMAANVLRKAGYSVGLFTSPALQTTRERFVLNGEMATEETLSRCAMRVCEAERALGLNFGGFARMLAAALLVFEGADFAVLEAGLGGRLDPTTSCAPTVSMITRIGLDHTDLLGSSIADIAREKSGILKPGVPCVVHPQENSAMQVIAARANELGCDLVRVDAIKITARENAPNRFALGDENFDFECGLLGAHQRENAAAVYLMAQTLSKMGFAITLKAVREGLKGVKLPCRMEFFEPNMLLDGAHNPQGALALEAALWQCFPGKKITLVTSIMRDKAVDDILDIFARFASRAVTLAVSQRAASAAELAAGFARRGIPATVAVSMQDALEQVCDSDLVVITGSLRLYGALRGAMAERLGH